MFATTTLRRAPFILPIASAFVALVVPIDANACGGPWDIACNVGATLQKAAQDTGRTLEKAGQDTGKTIEKAAQDTGKTIEKAAHDTGHAVEKAGQDVGKVLKDITNFSIPCKLPRSKPAALAPAYQASCDSAFSTYKNDLDVCNQAGGASLIAATAMGAAGLSAAATGGATLVLARAAFELCQKTCRSQDTLQTCTAQVDANAKGEAVGAQVISAANEAEQAKLREFECVDEAYAGEKLLVMDSVLASCEAHPKCNAAGPKFKTEFSAHVKAKMAEIQGRRDRALTSFKNGKHPIRDYGAVITSPGLRSLLLSYRGQFGAVCRATDSKLYLNMTLRDQPSKQVTLRFFRDGILVLTKRHNTGYYETEVSVGWPVDLAGMGFGKWRIELSEGKTKLGAYRFIYRAEK